MLYIETREDNLPHRNDDDIVNSLSSINLTHVLNLRLIFGWWQPNKLACNACRWTDFRAKYYTSTRCFKESFSTDLFFFLGEIEKNIFVIGI